MPVAYKTGEAQHHRSLKAEPHLRCIGHGRIGEVRAVDTVGHNMNAFGRDTARTHMISQHFRHGQYGISPAPCSSFCPAGKSLQSQTAAVLRALQHQGRVHLQQQRNTQAPFNHEAGKQEKVVALVNHMRLKIAGGGHQLAIGHQVVGQLHQLVSGLGQHGFEAMHPIHVAAHATTTLNHRIRIGFRRAWCHHTHFVPLAAQGVDHLYDVDSLTIFRSGAVVVEDFHDYPEQPGTLRSDSPLC